MTGSATEDGVSHLMEKWGYDQIWHENEVSWPEIPASVHAVLGSMLFIEGLPGTLVNVVALVTTLRCRNALTDPSGVILTNFIVANLCLSVLQYPFSGLSALAGRWLFGEIGCQVYGSVGFVFGIGSVLSLGLVILDLYLLTCSNWLQEKATLTRGRFSFLFVFLQWQFVILVASPPILKVMGRFYYEPFKTACTLDYWHRGFLNYPLYILILTTVAYIIPIAAMTSMLYSISKATSESASVISNTDPNQAHYEGMLKFCVRCVGAMGLCWSPYALMCLYTAVFDPSTINIYVTLIPTFAAKCAPLLNGCLVFAYIPRMQKGLQYLRVGGLLHASSATDIPQEVTRPLKPLKSK